MSAGESHIDVKMGSDRGYGLVFTAVFTLVGLWPLTADDGSIQVWSLGIGAAFLLVSFIGSPVIMAMLFFSDGSADKHHHAIVGQGSSAQNIDKSAPTYWIKRDVPPGPMKYQF